MSFQQDNILHSCPQCEVAPAVKMKELAKIATYIDDDNGYHQSASCLLPAPVSEAA